ncbi:uncharacterized protein METZ01_LOCUS227199 [marine metagenome]|uniref:Uncharacterized protein n=1 Tax=marine metagenome TaxID=408172 RepID=A0A382GHY3_9ZZZZ
MDNQGLGCALKLTSLSNIKPAKNQQVYPLLDNLMKNLDLIHRAYFGPIFALSVYSSY